MKLLQRNRITTNQNSQSHLEEKVLLAAANISFKFIGTVSKSVKKAAKQAKQFWGKHINTSKKMMVHIRENTKANGNTLGWWQAHGGGKNGLIQINSKANKNNAELVNTTIHEFGHAFGLRHIPDTIMKANSNGKLSSNVNKKILDQLKKRGWRK